MDQCKPQAGGVDVPCFHPDGQRASMLEFMLREFEQTGGGAGCRQGLTLAHFRAQLEQLQDTLMS